MTNWSEVNRQLEQELQREHAQRQARRRNQLRFHWSFLRWWKSSTNTPTVLQKGAQTKVSLKSA